MPDLFHPSVFFKALLRSLDQNQNLFRQWVLGPCGRTVAEKSVGRKLAVFRPFSGQPPPLPVGKNAEKMPTSFVLACFLSRDYLRLTLHQFCHDLPSVQSDTGDIRSTLGATGLEVANLG